MQDATSLAHSDPSDLLQTQTPVQTLADNEDRHNQLTDTLETHKYHFEQAVKVANFPEVSRLKELMQRTQFDIGERYS